MKRTAILLLMICLLITDSNLFSQNYIKKKAGICFRVDDNQTIEKYREFASIFDKYGYKFCFAYNLGPTMFDIVRCKMVRDFIKEGHEFMDHTPNHSTSCFLVNSSEEALAYSRLPGVDHTYQNKICLKYDQRIKKGEFIKEGYIYIKGDKGISVSNGEFANLGINFFIYLPAFDLVVIADNVYALNRTNSDTITLKSFWFEDLNIKTTSDKVKYCLINSNNIRMTYEARKILGERTKNLCEYYKLPVPKTFIQPGGYFSQFNREEIASVYGTLLNYTAAAIYPDMSAVCFNEYDPEHLARYGMQWGGFYDDMHSFRDNINTISYKIAKNYVLIGHSHFNNLLNGWNGYLSRIDSLLNWCKLKGVRVRTYSQWSSTLYDSLPNPYDNIIPSLDIDLNEDQYPDGYEPKYGIFSTEDGVAESGFKCFINDEKYNVCYITKLTGLEKGENIIQFYAKGEKNDSIALKFSFSEYSLSLPAQKFALNNGWTKYSYIIDIPDSVTFLDIYFYKVYNGLNDTLKLSGISMRKASELNIEINTQKSEINKEFLPIKLSDHLKNSFFKPNDLSWNFKSTGILDLEFDTANSILRIIKPFNFWIGEDTITCNISNPDGLNAKFRFVCSTREIKLCKGSEFNFTMPCPMPEIKWISVPYDSSIVKLDGQNFKLSPLITTFYKFEYRNLLDSLISKYFSIIIDTSPGKASKPSGKEQLCLDELNTSYSTKRIEGLTYDWTISPDNAGKILSDSSSCNVFWNPSFSGQANLYVNIENSCGIGSESDLLIIKRLQKPTVDFNEDIEKGNITFQNKTVNATSYKWDFGDGQYSTENNPVHFYNAQDYIVTLKAFNETCSDSLSKELLLTDMKRYNYNSKFRVYPNPCSGKIIKVISKDTLFENINYQLSGINGTIILNGALDHSNLIEIPGLPTGLYILNLKSGTYIQSEKIIIIR